MSEVAQFSRGLLDECHKSEVNWIKEDGEAMDKGKKEIMYYVLMN